MNKIIHTYHLEKWHDPAGTLDVSLHEGAIVSIGYEEVKTEREQALAWILLRLHAHSNELKSQIQTMSERLTKLQNEVDTANHFLRMGRE